MSNSDMCYLGAGDSIAGRPFALHIDPRHPKWYPEYCHNWGSSEEPELDTAGMAP